MLLRVESLSEGLSWIGTAAKSHSLLSDISLYFLTLGR